jgi:4-amino-4-deoxy-L-arabinose transferase-like glycosyltransferase
MAFLFLLSLQFKIYNECAMKRFYLSPVFFLSLIFAAGLLYRLYALQEIRQESVFQSYIPPHDSFYNIRAAQEFYKPVFPEPVSPFVPGSLYKYFMRLAWYVSGANLNLIRLFQILFSVSMIPVMYAIGIRLGNKATGILCSLFWAFNPDVILYDLQILQYALLFSLTVLTLYGCLYFQEKPSWPRFFSALLLILCLGQLRPFYYFLIFFLFYPLFKRLRNLPGRTLYYCFLICAVFSTLIAFLFYGPREIKTHIGIHMYFGFNKHSNGFYSDLPFIRDNTMGHFQEGVQLGQILSERYPRFAALHNFWLQKTFAYIWDNPSGVLRLICLKFYRLFFYRNWNDTEDINFQRVHWKSQKPAAVVYWLVLTLGFLGFLSQFLSRPARYSPFFLNAFLFLPVASVLGTCMEIRYQVQLIPLLCVFSGCGAQVFYHLFFEERKKFFLYGMAAILLSLLYYHAQTISKQRIQRNKIMFSDYQIRTRLNQDAEPLYFAYLEGKRRLSFAELEHLYLDFYQASNTTDAIGLLKARLKETLPFEEKFWCCFHLGEAYETQEFFQEAVMWYRQADVMRPSEKTKEKIKLNQVQYQRSVSPDSYT